MSFLSPSPAPVLPVSLFVSSARLLLERHLGLAWIGGEVSNLSRPASGHLYFLLKDDRAQVRCVLFRQKAQLLGFALREGMQVEVRATATIYEAKGEFQLNVDTVRHAGRGALFERFAQLKAKLEAAGWFAAERKRALPAFPRRAGIVTSRQAAALRDVLTALRRRMPGLRIILYPSPVQGEAAAAGLAAAIRTANARAEVDVLIVCRGGGSIEDLWSFNEPSVAKAIFDSRLPVVSAVGHETDFTICDFVADVRAATPTAAAALVVPERDALRNALGALSARSARSMRRALEWRMQRLDFVTPRLVHPSAYLAGQGRKLGSLAARMARAAQQGQSDRWRELAAARQSFVRRMRRPPAQRAALAHVRQSLNRCALHRLHGLKQRLAALGQNLRHLSPNAVLERGYSIVTRTDGSVVDDAARIAPGDTLALRFARGSAEAKVSRTDPDNESAA